MTQHANIDIEPLRYSRTDFTALRAWVQQIPVDRVRRLYYIEDAPQLVGGLERFLSNMREDLIERAVTANPLLANLLSLTREGAQITSGGLSVLIEASNAKPNDPQPSDPVGQWLRAKVAQQLFDEGIKTLGQLKAQIETLGPTWWTPIPRIGRLRAHALVSWLNKYENLAIDGRTQITDQAPDNALVALQDRPLPLERIAALPSHLDGHAGLNRSPVFSYIAAHNDLEAVRAYILKFRNQPHTARAYQRELERFLLWCIFERMKPMSSALVDDCEAYKAFLASPSPAFCGPRRGRFTPQWKPFTGALAPESQKQAVQILRTAMGWLHKVRYLGGNPWAAVSDPVVVQPLSAIKIERALPSDLFEKVVALATEQAQDPMNVQARISLAALLLMGDCGLRISEVANAKTDQLSPSPFALGQFKLVVLGKGKKLRNVPLSGRCLTAIKAHQDDLHLKYGQHPPSGCALIKPLTLPPGYATEIHESSWRGYAPNSLARLVKRTLTSISGLENIDIDEVIKLRNTSAHGLRHTFGTTATEKEMPLDVIQSILGHASIDTTSIYIRAQEKRVAIEAQKLYLNKA
jgi:site-specific recombinase XerD